MEKNNQVKKTFKPNDKYPYIKLTPNERGALINYGFRTFVKKDGKYLNYYIPGFDLHFSVTSEEVGHKRASAMVRTFFDLWARDAGPNPFFKELFRLGFRATEHKVTLKALTDKKILKAKFKSINNNMPKGFENAEPVDQENHLEVEMV